MPIEYSRPNPKWTDLDAEIAVKLFGWRWFRHKERNVVGLYPPDEEGYIAWMFFEEKMELLGDTDGGYPRYTDWYRCGGLSDERSRWHLYMPQFSGDLECAMMVDARMQAEGFRLKLTRRKDGKFWARYEHANGAGWKKLSGWRASMPLAICDAALAAFADLFNR